MLSATATRTILLIGKENVGKSSLVRAITGSAAEVGGTPTAIVACGYAVVVEVFARHRNECLLPETDSRILPQSPPP